MAGLFIEEDFYVKYRVIDPNSPAGQRIHAFFLARAKALVGKHIDFDKTPVTFVLSDEDEPNAFFMPVYDPKERPERKDYETVRYVRNPLPTPIICFTRGLTELTDNLDQLDWVEGHELTHRILRLDKGIRANSKGEELIADLHPVDLMYDAGGDPKQALAMSEKFSAYARAYQEKKKKKRRGENNEQEKSVNWSVILDVHMSDRNRHSGIEASLTRSSHLIDGREPTPLNRTEITAIYTDPVDEFIKSRGYDQKSAFAKLKILVDCVDHLAVHIPANEYFAQRLQEIAAIGQDDRDYWQAQRQREEIEKRVNAGYAGYFTGKAVPKKYQQKIANLAEAIVEEEKQQAEQRSDKQGNTGINGAALSLYIQDKAYRHINRYGYPEQYDLNYSDAAGVIYSYFYRLSQDYTLHRNARLGKDTTKQKLPRIEIDINAQVQKIKKATNAQEFKAAYYALRRLIDIQHDIRTADEIKLDNLSDVRGSRFDSYLEKKSPYPALQRGQVAPWNNLVEIAATDEEAKACVIAFLGDQGITDYRITHGSPYIQVSGREKDFGLDGAGRVVDRAVPPYATDFAIHRETVLAAYDYIKAYYADEEAFINATCAAAAQINHRDFREDETVTETFNRHSIAKRKVHDFISLYNALPAPKGQKKPRKKDNAFSLIPLRYRQEKPIPGFGRKGDPFLNGMLFDFGNPIFQEHFGTDFKNKLVARKNAQGQAMFGTTLAILERAIDIWIETKPIAIDTKRQHEELQREVWRLPEGDDRKQKERKRKGLYKRSEFYCSKAQEMEALVSNILSSVIDKNEYSFQLHRLTPEQKKTLASFVLKNEKGVMLDIFNAKTYEHFCDYLGVLEEQTTRIISGRYELTERMQAVARNYGYQPARSPEEMVAFIEGNQDGRPHHENKKYAWYLHAFNVMAQLEGTPRIDLRGLLISLKGIKEEKPTGHEREAPKLVEARYRNYKRLMGEGRLVALVSRAINHQENYADLSFEGKIEIADLLIRTKGQMESALAKSGEFDYGTSKYKIWYEPEHQDFLERLDTNINGLLRKAEDQALQEPEALARVRNLYQLYHPRKKNSHYSERSRESYLEESDKKEGRLKHISNLCQGPDFWPIDVLDHVKAFVFAKNTFLDDKELENRILGNLLDKLEQHPSGRQKNECLYILLDKNLRAAYPETRDRLFDMYTQEVVTRLGKDDGSKKYQRKLAVYLKALENATKKPWDIGPQHGTGNQLLSNSIAAADKYLLLRRVSDAIVSQEQTSQMIKESCQISLGSDDMIRSYLYGVGVDYLSEEMDKDADIAANFIQFLNSKGEQKDCSQVSAYIEQAMTKKYDNRFGRLDIIRECTRPTNCKVFYENFWSAPLEARAFIIARMLKSAVNDTDVAQGSAEQSWEGIFDVVMNNVIRADDQSIEAQYAREIMHSYVKSRSDYERVLILSAMMVANRNIGADVGNVGKALRIFFENMGPAEIKLGQAIASHPNTPENLKRELQHLKSAANIPPRWVVYDWIKLEKIPEELWKDQYLGEIMGSASYYTSIALGEDGVLRILRPEAREKAAKGFRVIHAAVDDLETKERTSNLSYRELTCSVEEMIIQAARMSEIETDHDAGQEQYEHAKKLYDGVTLTSSGHTFPLKVMDWRAKGKNWIIMDRAKGLMFNDLPEATAEQIAYKKNFARGYILFELTNIFSGRKFDHDRHGAQLSIDPETNLAGIYDTGAMALRDPSREEQKMLGGVIYAVLKSVRGGSNVVDAFGKVLGDKIEELHQTGQDTQYLVEVNKGILALGDFFNVLDQQDVQEILLSMDILNDWSVDVQHGIMCEMSSPEKEEWTGTLALLAARGPQDIIVHRPAKPTHDAIKVDHFTVLPSIRDKAAWLHDVFKAASDDDGGDTDKSSFTYDPVNMSKRDVSVGMRLQ